MKRGARALGVADSYRPDADRSTLAAAVVRADRVVDGLDFSTVAVGGTDATGRLIGLIDRIGRPDVGTVLVAGVAPAWYNVLDVARVADAVDRPVVSVSFEESEGLVAPLREAFSGTALATRLATYERQPPRRPVAVNGERLWLRAAGCSPAEAERLIRGFTPEGGRPEPLRIARLAARAGDAFRASGDWRRG